MTSAVKVEVLELDPAHPAVPKPPSWRSHTRAGSPDLDEAQVKCKQCSRGPSALYIYIADILDL